MVRYARELYCGQYFHFMHRSNNHIFLFKDEKDFECYLGLLREYLKKNKVECLHYALMNTHVHMVLKMPDTVKYVPNMMKNMNLTYTLYYKRKYGYEGSLWRGRYKSDLIDNDRYMLACGMYIEHNPVRAGIVKEAKEYKWSSYRHWSEGATDCLLSEHPLVGEIRNYSQIAEDYREIYVEYTRLAKCIL